MAWKNGPLELYHGCDDVAAKNIVSKGIDLRLCRPRTDFGPGFYTTTVLHQAQQWANARVRRQRHGGKTKSRATVIKFVVDRFPLAQQETMGLVVEGKPAASDFWEFVSYCRGGVTTHIPGTPNAFYDVVFGLVSLWPQLLVIKDCDQISFHTLRAVTALLSKPVIADTAAPISGLF